MSRKAVDDELLDRVFKALSSRTRRELLDLLKERPRTTGELCARFPGLDRCTVMQHLAVLEDAAGSLVGVEVKSAARVGEGDFKGLRALATAVPDLLHRGVVLYAGREVVAFGERLHAVPLPAMWQW